MRLILPRPVGLYKVFAAGNAAVHLPRAELTEGSDAAVRCNGLGGYCPTLLIGLRQRLDDFPKRDDFEMIWRVRPVMVPDTFWLYGR
jgi:hypothetical protein